MKDKILIFGASGQIGKSLVRKLTNANYVVTAVSRNLHTRGHILKTQGPPGYIILEECQIFNETKIRELVKQNSIVINLIGILYEKRKVNTFETIHEKWPEFLSTICQEYSVKQFIHLSALGIENAKDSLYALSKLNGEANIKENFKSATILRPSVVFSADDDFTVRFMSLLSKIPFVFPLYYSGKTLFSPIHVSDLTEIIYQVIVQDIKSTTIECVGLEEISLQNILQRLLKLIGKKRLLIPIPLLLAKLSTRFIFQLFPKPLLTLDQLRLLRYDNVASGKFESNFDIGMGSKANFDLEIKKYSWMYSEREESLVKKNIKIVINKSHFI